MMSNDLVQALEDWLAEKTVPYAGDDIEPGAILMFADNGYIVPANASDSSWHNRFVGIAKRNIKRGEAMIISVDDRSDVQIQGTFKPLPSPKNAIYFT